ncbi:MULTISPECIES: helix-turn-helix domain-containing protein [Sphingobium]|nr:MULTISPECIES: helix-turn-helix domain-containing protein [Sphingobium]AYO75667.1 AraC family transcriptional regulator [Sphingobium yanoikuyae]
MRAGSADAFKVTETHGILMRPEHQIVQSSDTLGWRSLYASHQFERPYSDRFEGRDDHLIIVHLSGPVRVERNLSGEQEKQRIAPGGLFVLPPNQDFGVSLTAPLETIHLYIRRSLIRAAAQELCKGDPEKVEFLPRFGERDPLIEQMGRMVCGMMADNQSDFFADGVARLLAAQIVRHHSCGLQAELPRITGLNQRQLEAVHDVIEERMEESLSIDDLAEAVGLSPIHFARQFKRSTGKAPHQYLIEMRVSRARHLLAGDLPIAEIAYRCGFSHQEHLTRLFGRQQGTTPAAYRRALRL